MDQQRKLIFYKNYFDEFFNSQTRKAQEKIDYVLFLITIADRIPKKSQKTPQKEIDKALKIKQEYFNDKIKKTDYEKR